jgi:autotransporter-associated beta strand protein
LVFNRSNAITQGMDFANVIAGSGNIIKNGAGSLTLNGTNTFTGQLTIAEGTLSVSTLNNSGVAGVLGNSTNSVILGSAGKNGTLSYTGGALTVNKTFTMAAGGTGVVDIGAGGQLTVGVISGSGVLSKSGAGTLVLGSANTYSGGSILGSGLVAVSTDSVGTAGSPISGAFGTGTVNLAGAQLRAGTGGSRTIGNTVIISANTTFATTGGEKSLTFTGPVTLNGATRTLNVAIGSTVSTEKLTFSGVIGDGGNGYGITKTGAGTLALSAANTYTGTTTVSAGTLEIGHVNALQNTTLDTGTSGSQTVNFTVSGANTYNIGGLQGSDALSIGNNTISIGANNANTTYSGSISGTGNLVKNGSGIQTLAGATTFNGTTTVTSGTLEAATTGALANTSQVVLNEGGSFLVTADNAVNDSAAINLNGGRMALSGNFDETVGLLTLSANSTLDFSGFGGTLRFGGIGSWATGATLAIWNWSGTTQYGTQVNNYANPSNLVFTNNSTLTSNLANISFYSDSGNSFVGNGFGKDFMGPGGGTEIIAVPEPEAFLYAVVLLAGVAVQYLRRRAKQKFCRLSLTGVGQKS